MKRGMIFITFFGSCLAMALTIVSLGTKFWITSRAKRTSNPLESDGIINFGLFDGKKELNVAYGWRIYDIDGKHACIKKIFRKLCGSENFNESAFYLIFLKPRNGC